MAKDKKKNDTTKKAAAQKGQSKKQDAKLAKAKDGKKADKGSKKSGPVSEKKPNIFARLFTYLVEVRAELKRVTWPTREKVVYLVGVVVVTLLFFAVFTALVDWGSSEGVVALNSLTETERAPINNEIPVEIDLGDIDFGEGGVVGEESVGIEFETDLSGDAEVEYEDADGTEE